MSPTLDLLRERHFSHYEVIERLGSGGMGEVYRARDQLLGREVAIKVLRERLVPDPERMARFEQEARAASALNHPNIVTIYEIGRVDATPYIAMELVSGKTLRELLIGGGLSPRRGLQLAVQLAEGLAQAHGAGIVHRDLKPENIMVTDDGRLKILDFGLAKLVPPTVSEDADTGSLHSPGTQPGLILGTVGYMSPEQALGRALGFHSDQFTFGSILYEIVAGRPAFRQASAVQTLAAIIEKEPEPISEVAPEVPPPVQWVVERCLAKEPQERYASTRDLARDLQNLLERLPEISGSIRRSEVAAALHTLTGPLRRRRRPLRLAVATLALVGAVAAAALWLAWRGPAAPLSKPTPAPTPRRSVAVLGFKNLSGRSEAAWLSTALAEMLTTELAAGGRMRTVSGENVGRMKLELALSEAESLAPDTLSRVGTNLGTDMVLLGSYFWQPGGRLRVDLRLQDVGNGETLVATAENGTEVGLVDLVTHAGSQLRRSIGIEQPSGAEAGVLKAGVPSNLAAQRLYAEGIGRLRILDALGAKGLLSKAVAADPSSPLAHSALAEAWAWLGYDARARDEARRAFDLSSGLSREERLLVEARSHQTAGEWDKAVENYRLLYGFYPDNLEYGLRLASAEAFAGRGPQALATLETLRRLPLPLSADPRIDLTEAEVGQAVGDVKRQQLAAARAAARGSALGALLVAAQARLLEAFALGRLGQGDKAGAAAEEARAIFASAGDRGGVGWALNRVGSVQLQQGALVKARKTYEQSLALLREIGYQHRVAAVLSNIGLVLSQQGELAAAKSKYQESQAIDTELGDKIGVAFDLSNIAMALHEEGEPAQAKAMLERALAVSREAGDDSTTGIVLQQVGDVLISLGELKRAREHELQALDILQRTGSHRDATAALFSLGELMALEGDVAAARNRHQEVLAIREGLGDSLQSASSRLALAALELEERRPASAESFAREAASVFGREEVRDKEALAWALLSRAQLDQTQLDAAQRSLVRAEALAAASQSPARRLTVALTAGLVGAAGGRGADAVVALETALAEANRRQLNRLALEIRLALGQLELRGLKADAGRRRLQALAAEARSRGFGLLTQRAADFLAASPQSR